MLPVIDRVRTPCASSRGGVDTEPNSPAPPEAGKHSHTSAGCTDSAMREGSPLPRQ